MRPRWILLIASLAVLIGIGTSWDAVETRSAPQPIVVVDAGHGGADPGAIGWNGIREKRVNLEIAQLVRLKSLNHPELSVVLTRRDDTTLSLRDRIQLAHRLHARLYVSIHANAHRNERAHGFETLTHESPSKPNYTPSRRFARVMDGRLDSRLGAVAEQRGVRQQRLYLRWARIPAVLVETGFLTNPTEAKRLQRIWYQARVADGILSGIRAYLDRS